MEWLQNNWIWIAAGAAFFAMHVFGHGGHSGHSKHGGDDTRSPKPSNDVTAALGAERTDLNFVVPTAANPSHPALGGRLAHSDHAAAPTTKDEKQHRHGC